MAAYLMVNITVTDPVRYQEYRERAPAAVSRYGGRYIVRGGAVHPLEGELGFDRFVVVEFPSLEMAKRFYDSPEYAPLLKLRRESTHSRAALVEGYLPP
ncbi:MAG: DUF1330 domain-containing protein [Acetobacteraceae bacterium]|nr:DUF1330 domain-containing protein [Acetobacteraceae bacterium]MBV8525380.1 DUF1330 domain-containing protein [Acetobacteraceae bacterium]